MRMRRIVALAVFVMSISWAALAMANQISGLYYFHNRHPVHDTGRLYHDPVRSMAEDSVRCSHYLKFDMPETADDLERFYGESVITRVYYHIWIRDEVPAQDVGVLAGFGQPGSSLSLLESEGDLVGQVGPANSPYSLMTDVWDGREDIVIDEASAYQFRVVLHSVGLMMRLPIRADLQSFMIINLEDDATLQQLDRDGDGLTDYDELFNRGTNPYSRDTDLDGCCDLQEVDDGTDPWNPYDKLTPDPLYDGYRLPVVWVDDYNHPADPLHVPDGSYEDPYDSIMDALSHSAWTWDAIVLLDNDNDPGRSYLVNQPISFAGESIVFRSAHGPYGCRISARGGRAFMLNDAEPVTSRIEGITILDGLADNGGAVYLGQDVGTSLVNCIFRNNEATQDGGAVYSEDNRAKVTNCVFDGNSALGNGGALCYAGAIGPGNYALTVRNSLFVDNEAMRGGGLAIAGPSSGDARLVNCAFVANRSDISPGGGVYLNGMDTILNDCIFWDNLAALGPQIALEPNSGALYTVDVTYCDIEGGPMSVHGTGGDGTLGWLQGNLDTDPDFVGMGLVPGNYRLDDQSSCRDAGDPRFVPEPGELDLAGNPRVVNGIVDMGPFESAVVNQQAKRIAATGETGMARRPTSLQIGVYPNPCNPRTTVSFSLPAASEVVVSIFDLRGNLVRTLISEVRQAGDHHVDWNGVDQIGRSVGSGLYWIRVKTREHSTMQAVTVIR